MHHALHHSTCVSCIDILDRSVCARHTFEYTMYVFVLVGLWTHQFMTYDVMLLDQCLIDLLPLPAIHPHLFARDYRKKQPPVASPPHVRSMHRPLFAHSPIFLLTPGQCCSYLSVPTSRRKRMDGSCISLSKFRKRRVSTSGLLIDADNLSNANLPI